MTEREAVYLFIDRMQAALDELSASLRPSPENPETAVSRTE